MVISKITAGFGNQLFQYAASYALAIEKKDKIIIDKAFYDYGYFRELDLFKFNIRADDTITYKQNKNLFGRAFKNRFNRMKAIGINTKYLKEKGSKKYDKSFFNFKENKNVYVTGYRQSYKYFEKYKEDIIKMYIPNIKLSNEANRIINYIESIDNTVSIHIRRGDYIKCGACIDISYYDSAIAKIRESIKEPKLIIFSDDISYIKKKFIKYYDLEIIFIEYESKERTIEDLWIMTKCKNNIIANSSYSWWGAYLNSNINKIVIAPVIGDWRNEFYPEEWLLIEAQYITLKV